MLIYKQKVSKNDKNFFEFILGALGLGNPPFTLTFHIGKYEVDITAVPNDSEEAWRAGDDEGYVDAVMFLDGQEVSVCAPMPRSSRLSIWGDSLTGEYLFTGVDGEEICLIIE